MREMERDFSFYGFPFEILIGKSVVRRRRGEVREIDCSVSASRIAQMNKRCGNGGEQRTETLVSELTVYLLQSIFHF